ncbi:hypothetical protein [Solicola sp. PLA-1-18]|uniref:hypothetical protein n=1 Tax=Solicola sp. PLA-1-18 TaxID=3380532 RepID=UPI003B7C3A10
MSTRIVRGPAALLAHMSPSTVTAPHPTWWCRLGLHHFEPAGTDPSSPWIVLADECACGAQRPLPL